MVTKHVRSKYAAMMTPEQQLRDDDEESIEKKPVVTEKRPYAEVTITCESIDRYQQADKTHTKQ